MEKDSASVQMINISKILKKRVIIDHNVRKAIGLGMNPIDAICMATINLQNVMD